MCSSSPQHSIISYFKNYLRRVMPSLCQAEENLVGQDVSRKKMHFTSGKEHVAAIVLLPLALSWIALGAWRHLAVPVMKANIFKHPLVCGELSKVSWFVGCAVPRMSLPVLFKKAFLAVPWQTSDLLAVPQNVCGCQYNQTCCYSSTSDPSHWSLFLCWLKQPSLSVVPSDWPTPWRSRTLKEASLGLRVGP